MSQESVRNSHRVTQRELCDAEGMRIFSQSSQSYPKGTLWRRRNENIFLGPAGGYRMSFRCVALLYVQFTMQLLPHCLC